MEQLMEISRTAQALRTAQASRTAPASRTAGHAAPAAGAHHLAGSARRPGSTRSGGSAQWLAVCQLHDLEDSWGEAALINGQQVALFRVGEREVFAVSHADPATHSHVMARGVVGSRGTTYTIASPLHKEVYSLSTGECFGRPDLRLATYPVRVINGTVEVSC